MISQAGIKFDVSDVPDQDLLDRLPMAAYGISAPDGVIAWFNTEAVRIWGRRPPIGDLDERFCGSYRLYRSDGSFMAHSDTPIAEVLKTGVSLREVDVIIERPDGGRSTVCVHLDAVRDDKGNIIGVTNFFYDVTERKQREDQIRKQAEMLAKSVAELERAQREREALLAELKRSNEELSQFAYAVSHDLHGPVRTVRTLTELLVGRGVDSKEEASHLAGLIEQATQGMERLIDSLLRCAQAGQSELSPKQVSIEAVVDAVCLSLSALINSTGTSITRADLPTVDADPAQLEQLFQNLISNAIKYRRPEIAPQIDIRSERAGGEWRISVKDNGEGIAPEHKGLIFQAMKRLHGSDTPGSGLGLAICKTIVARHGGHIWVESDGQGHGSTFRFTLPAAGPRMEPAGPDRIAGTA